MATTWWRCNSQIHFHPAVQSATRNFPHLGRRKQQRLNPLKNKQRHLDIPCQSHRFCFHTLRLQLNKSVIPFKAHFPLTSKCFGLQYATTACFVCPPDNGVNYNLRRLIWSWCGCGRVSIGGLFRWSGGRCVRLRRFCCLIVLQVSFSFYLFVESV